ncbi:MetQ/NlpA family ABC transporter substrate-binding protein [Cellulomonas chengniuliangii]|uniref:MetQ/NlpA family ABC transporter substrate-binding protein n=1 Tax=Cellulomonas chengniuliangii TaxID=2968084 RepID=A0ABY5KZP1_9CELL|nr:MetQ/NlpA family ABC transporter substrate-binding protein [Cellulomonas chengniuliangii]MCC2307212.1 MetQ/NlpA family ABC transporter substrate-binding protein [Cellulomonas chengniuliangii]UUI75992.1 MetQ/NlpA family ABC transporter substrate-binding protein [Cellulomonas chengniuliangii]
MLRTLARTLAAASAVALLAACAGTSDAASDAGDASEVVRIGVVGASDDYWKVFTDAAAEEGIEVELVNFTDYTQPNPALSQGQLDLNQFQHLQYLAQYNVGTDEDLTPIGATAVYPLGLYSKKFTSVDEIPAGSEIAIPNDPTNQARALLVLQDAGLLKLKDGGTSVAIPADIIEAESTVTVTPVDATQTAVALNSVAGSIINNDFLKDAGLASTDALYQDQADSPGARPYINIWVARAEDKDNATYLKLVEVYQTPAVQEGLLENSGGTAVFAHQSGAELQGYLADIQKAVAAQG